MSSSSEGIGIEESAIKSDMVDALLESPNGPIKAEPCFEGTSEEMFLEENLKPFDSTQDMDSSGWMMKMEQDDAGVSMEPSSIKTESDFEGISEKTLMEENLKAIDGTEDMDNRNFAIKRDSDASETLMTPLFVAVKSEPVFEETCGEIFVQRNIERSEITEDLYEENKWRHIDFSPSSCSSQIVSSSSTQSPPEMAEMNSQKPAIKNSSSEHETVLLPSGESQKSSADASCSTGDDRKGYDEGIDEYLLESHYEQSLAQEELMLLSYQCEGRSCTNNEETLLQTETPQSGLLKSPSNERPLKCSHCGKALKTKHSLINHVRNHMGETPCKCTHCGKSFSNCSSVTEHMCQNSGEKPYKCSECEEVFTQNCDLIRHLRLHTKDRPYKCSRCEQSFTDSAVLTAHMHLHTGEKPYRCSQCGKSFSDRSALIVHMRIHSGDKPHKCPQCMRCFRHSSTFKRHMQMHRGKKQHKCSQCGKSFSDRSTLIVHMRIHSGDKPHKCPQCMKCFRHSSTFKRHMQMHRGKKLNKCSQCGKSFTHSSNLSKHMNKHTENRPYKCCNCGASFRQSSHLTRHMGTHTGNRPYKCSQCEKSFTQGSHLTRHMKTHSE